MYQTGKSDKVPKWCKEISPQEFLKQFAWKPLPLDKWKKIHYIGDLQGCFSPLKNYLGAGILRKISQLIADGLKAEEFYIFVGDLLDRGIENDQVLEFVLKNYEKENFKVIEGNHDTYYFL
jgi:hypothetical protein